MIWIILQLIFCAVPFAASFVLYKSKRRFMANFYMAMVHRVKARKLYVQVWLMLLLFFHYTYTCVYIGEFGILFSTGVCAAMFSFRRTDKWFRKLLDRPRAFVTLASVALVICFIPHLYSVALTVAYLLLAALFYPSVRVLSECRDKGIASGRIGQSEICAESYHDNHHARLPQDADNGNLIHPLNNNHQKQNENEK